MEYTCLGKDPQGFNLYELTLNVFRDCQPTIDFPTNTPFDPEVTIQIYNALNNSLETEVIISLTDTLVLPLTGSDTCVAPPTNLCYAVGTYTTTIRLRDNPAGYEVVWGRCCRNETIQNILQPGEFGMAVNALIPNTALCNSSPSFTNLLPTYICRNDLFSFDHSAIDPDGDVLRYEIVTPFTAGSQTDPAPVVPPPPFQPIAWLPGYSINNVMDGNPALTVDPNTGVLSVRPTNPGQYVFSLRVTESRNGSVISRIQRDIQVNVIECPINFPPNIQLPGQDLVRGDSLLFERDKESCFSLIISDQNGPGVGDDFLSFSFDGPHLNLPNSADIQTQRISDDSILVNICWTPDCDFMDFDQNLLVFQVNDENDCPGPNIINDTIFFRTIAPELQVPEISCVQVLGPDQIVIEFVPLSPDQQNAFTYYSLRRNDGGGYTEIAQITDPNQTSYEDRSITDADSRNYCYQLSVVKSCPTPEMGAPSQEVCSEAQAGAGICVVGYVDNQLTVFWPENTAASFQAYRIYRVENGSRSLALETTDRSLTQWRDELVQDFGQSYCYELALLNTCDVEIFTGEHCSIPIEVEDRETEIQINWGIYEGWPNGVATYMISRRTANNEQVIGSLPPNAPLEWIDRDISIDDGGLYCYRIEAVPANAINCNEEAWSAELCISYEPTVFAANAFTPNGDGINDVWEVKGRFFSRVDLRIFNQWGREVFASNRLDVGWDGLSNGKAAPEGVYVYRIEYEDFQGGVFQRSGSITLIR